MNVKSTRPDVGASERAKEPGRASRQGHVSTSHDTTSLHQGQKISDHLLSGRGNAVPLHDLVSITGLSERAVRKQIERERRAGVPIVSDNVHGYWLAAGPEEAQRFARSMLARAGEIRKTARAVEAAAGKTDVPPSVGTPGDGEAAT